MKNKLKHLKRITEISQTNDYMIHFKNANSLSIYIEDLAAQCNKKGANVNVGRYAYDTNLIKMTVNDFSYLKDLGAQCAGLKDEMLSEYYKGIIGALKVHLNSFSLTSRGKETIYGSLLSEIKKASCNKYQEHELVLSFENPNEHKGLLRQILNSYGESGIIRDYIYFIAKGYVITPLYNSKYKDLITKEQMRELEAF